MSTYTIKELSEKFHLPATTLRYYEQVGILTNIPRSPSGQRVYEEKHVNRLKTICCFKGTGMSISQLQAFFSYESNEVENIDAILDLLNGQKASVESQLLQLQKDYEHIQRKLAYYGEIKRAAQAGQPLPDWADYRRRAFTGGVPTARAEEPSGGGPPQK